MSELELEQPTNIKFLVRFEVSTAVTMMIIIFWEMIIIIKFLVNLGKSGSEIREMLVQVYGDNDMKTTAVYKWVTRFSERRETVTDEGRSGAASNVQN
jgi:hypothetical protein